MKDKKTIDSFIAYCKSHPHERFWQALRNWSGADFIWHTVGKLSLDTFYWTSRDGERNLKP